MIIASAIFVVALLGIVALFAVKFWEVSREEVIAPKLRGRADDRALKIKERLLNSRHEISKLPPFLMYLGRMTLHESALMLAALGRILEREAHRLADLASHKHKFERKETKSEFLKQVTDHKNGSLDSRA